MPSDQDVREGLSKETFLWATNEFEQMEDIFRFDEEIPNGK